MWPKDGNIPREAKQHCGRYVRKRLFSPGMNGSQQTPQDGGKQDRYDRAYLKMAAEWAKLSHCTRKKVGALLVREGMIISDGYNGTPSGFPNICEDEHGDTHWYVLHAEANAIMKVARSTNAAQNSTLYITLSPCRECCKLILQAGIRRMVYMHGYKDDTAIHFLRDAGIEVVQIENP
jgi:dCMP deaminase